MNQRGFAFLPFLMANWQMIAIAGLALVVVGYYLHCEHVKKDHATFVAKLEAQAAEQQRQNKLKEAANAKQIKDALSERDVALAKLRVSSRAERLPVLPASPTNASGICFSRTGFESAFGTLYSDLQGIAEIGDTAVINGKAWRDSWPK